MPVRGFEPRSMITQIFQWGVENIGDPGNGGTADQRLGTFNSQISPVGSGAFGVFRPSGGKYVGQIVPTDIYAEGAFTDTIDFNTIPFLFAGNVGWVAGVEDSGTPKATTWRHTPIPFGVGTQRTFVIEEGTPTAGSIDGAVYNYNNGIIPDLSMRFMRTGASQATGRIVARKLDPSTDFSAGLATLRRGRSISPTKIGVWEADTFAHLSSAATRLAPVALDLSWRHNNVFTPWFAMDDGIISFAGTLEDAIDAGVQITIMADVDVDDIAAANGALKHFNYASMEDGSDLYLKILVIGLIIHDAIPETLHMDMHLQISGPPRRANVGSVRVWQWDALMTPDATAGVPFDITVIDTLPTAAIPTLP